MIIKIKSHKRPIFKKLLEYILNDKGRKYGTKRKSFVITHNLKGNSIELWSQQFKHNEKYRLRKRKGNTLVFHEIISWHRDDAQNITASKLEVIAREYIRQRNSNGIYVAAPHFDKDHYHIHICSSGIEYRTGKSLRLSKNDLLQLKKSFQDFQLKHFPELSHSTIAHGSKSKLLIPERGYQFKLRTGREIDKQKVMEIAKQCYKRAHSSQSFFKLLTSAGLKPYQRSGTIAGVIHKDYKFRFSRLGFTKDQLTMLDRSENRTKALDKARALPLEQKKPTLER